MLRKATDQLVIKPRLSSTARLFAALAGVMVVVGVSVLGYWGGREAVYAQLRSRAEEIERLENELQQSRERRELLQTELQGAREELGTMQDKLEETQSSLTKVTRQLQIDQSAYQELRKQLEQSNRQITDLGTELKFYRSIISPADGESGVRIQEFELRTTETDNEYQYHLILIQALEHEDTVKGTVRFEIHGSVQGAPKTVYRPDKSESAISAKFKYFQTLAGRLKLPKGFMPAEVKVLFERGDKTVVERLYPWPIDGQQDGDNA